MYKLPPIDQKHLSTMDNNSLPKHLKIQSDQTKLPQVKNYDLAIDYYSKGLNQNKENIIFLIKRAICYLAKGYYTLALKDALKSIEKDESYSKGLQNLRIEVF